MWVNLVENPQNVTHVWGFNHRDTKTTSRLFPVSLTTAEYNRACLGDVRPARRPDQSRTINGQRAMFGAVWCTHSITLNRVLIIKTFGKALLVRWNQTDLFYSSSLHFRPAKGSARFCLLIKTDCAKKKAAYWIIGDWRVHGVQNDRKIGKHSKNIRKKKEKKKTTSFFKKWKRRLRHFIHQDK